MEEKIIVPDSIMPIIAWRFWRVAECFEFNKKEIFKLMSAISHCLWPEKEKLVSKCHCRDEENKPYYHEICLTDSLCGIHAYKSLDNLFKDRILIKNYGALFGKVYLWGKVQCHEFGYRAQFAYPQLILGAICEECKSIISLDSAVFIESGGGQTLNGFLRYEIFCERCACNAKMKRKDMIFNKSIYGRKVSGVLKNRYNIEIKDLIIQKRD